MRLRLVAFAVMMLFGASPLATAICDAMCAQHASAHHEGHRHACCHDEQATGTALQAATVSVTCGAPVADVLTVARPVHEDGRSALVAAAATGATAPIMVVSLATVHPASHSPTNSRSASQLRI